MGAICCCLWDEDFEEYSPTGSSIFRHCISLRYFLQQLFSGYNLVPHRLKGHAVSSATQDTTSTAATEMGEALPDNSAELYNIDQRFSHSQRGGLVFRREKSMGNFQDESQPLRTSSSSNIEPLGTGKKRIGIDSKEESKTVTSGKVLYGLVYTPSSEDEDVCHTCLDEYTPENSKIVMKCSHYFHLGCIYKWMERSDNCPICGKEMEFRESP